MKKAQPQETGRETMADALARADAVMDRFTKRYEAHKQAAEAEFERWLYETDCDQLADAVAERIRRPAAKDSAGWRTPPQIAKQLGVDGRKVLAWIASGELPAVNVACETATQPRYRVSEESLAEFLATRCAAPAKPKKRQRSKRAPYKRFI